MPMLRIRTASPQVHLAATRACRHQLLRRVYLVATLAGDPLDDALVEGLADLCEAAGLSVHRGSQVVTVDRGTVDVDAAWRAARAHVRREHERLYALSQRHVVAALKGVETRRRRHAERIATGKLLADLVL